MRREGWYVNRTRVYRIYREAGRAVRRRRRKRIGVVERKPLPRPSAVNQSWSMTSAVNVWRSRSTLRCLELGSVT